MGQVNTSDQDEGETSARPQVRASESGKVRPAAVVTSELGLAV
jgi:hypothetical protein